MEKQNAKNYGNDQLLIVATASSYITILLCKFIGILIICWGWAVGSFLLLMTIFYFIRMIYDYIYEREIINDKQKEKTK